MNYILYLKYNNKISNMFYFNIYKKQELIKQLVNKDEKKEYDLQKELDNVEVNEMEKIRDLLEWEYQYKVPSNIMTKTSVTKIKSMKTDTDFQDNANYKTPKFLEKKMISSSEKGTLIHLVLQRLDIKKSYKLMDVQKLIDELENKGIINEDQKKAIDITKIYEFTKTSIWKEMQNAKTLERERPFYINVPVKEVYDEDIGEDILVQGVIDLYYVTDDYKIVLVDYKIDRVNSENELVNKYKDQLKLYKRALEYSLGKNVDNVYIYSVYMNKEVSVKIF